MEIQITRLNLTQTAEAANLFTLMSEVFGEPANPLPETYIAQLLNNDSFWAVAAISGEQVIGGLTAHVLPMTRAQQSELMIYDVAVHESFQRTGVGLKLIDRVRTEAAEAGLSTVFVLADNADTHAISFYKKARGSASAVAMFSW